MSIIEKLTEGIVNRDMKAEGSALLDKWASTGLLEGLETQHQKATMSRLLENQAKELLRESSSMASGDVEGFAAVAFPIVRRVFAGLIANDLVSVQPMSLPSGLIFFLDFVYSPNVGSSSSAYSRFGNTASDASPASIYGSDKVGSEVISGVNLAGTLGESLSGPGRDGAVGYAFASATGSLTVAQSDITSVENIRLISSITEAQKKTLQYDPDLLALVDADGTNTVFRLRVETGDVPSDLDVENLSAIQITEAQFVAATDADGGKQVRRLTKKNADGDIDFFFVDTHARMANSAAAMGADLTGSYPAIDTLTTTGASIGGVLASALPFEGNEDIPEIDIKVDSTAITAQTKKLKAKWTPELGQDLNAYHNLDAEVELTSILSEQIALEIDREILADLVNGATAATYYWSRSPGLFVNKVTGEELGATSAAPDFTGTVSEWYETLIETINDVSAQIHRKTLRGGANYVVVSPEVANILEFTSGFRANVTADADKGDIGAVKAGSLSRKFDVIVDPYFPRNVVLVGRKGASFLESGYVYAPYVPLQTTPTIFGPEDFVPRKGVMTRYAKKMVRPDMYGLVIVRDLLGGEGAS